MTIQSNPSIIARLLSLLLLFDIQTSLCYHQCSPEDGGGICPDYDTCCPTGTPGVSSCISAKKDKPATCCLDDKMTGCRNGYECRSNRVQSSFLRPQQQTKELYCQLVEPDPDSRAPQPSVLPRYKLTTLTHEILTRVYGLPMIQEEKEENNNNGVDETPNVAYFSSMGSLDSNNVTDLQNHQRVTTVWIVVHGSGRTAEDYLYGAVSSLPRNQQDPSNSTILVLSPWFLDPGDDCHDNTNNEDSIPIPLPPNTLRWHEVGPISHTWRYGANAIHSNWSSFDAMDKLTERLVADELRFPNLERIVVAGHSAGGQYVQRWALLSNSPVWDEPASSTNLAQRSLWQQSARSIQIRAIPANPRCFAMLDDQRYIHDDASNTNIFRRPDDSVIAECPDYNQWIWGLEPGGDITAPYKDRAIKEAGGPKALAHRYVTERNVVYLAGEQDLEVFQDDCGSVLQGPTRRERSYNFMQSLNELYPKEMKTPRHKRLLAEGVPHDHALIFQSPAGQEALFGDDNN